MSKHLPTRHIEKLDAQTRAHMQFAGPMNLAAVLSREGLKACHSRVTSCTLHARTCIIKVQDGTNIKIDVTSVIIETS